MPANKLHVIAIDYSGSTHNKKEYWEKALSLLLESNDNETKYLFWDHREQPEVVDKITATEKALALKGFGCTDPSTFISFLITQALEAKKNKLSFNATILTDGQITPKGYRNSFGPFSEEELKHDAIQCIVKCDEQLEANKIEFSKFNIHFVNTGGQIDQSVAAPFLRRAQQYSIYLNDELAKQEAKLDLDSYKDKPEKFLKDSELILSQIASQVLGTDGATIHLGLVKLQKNLLNKIQKDKAVLNKNSELIDQILNSLTHQDEDFTLKLMNDLLIKETNSPNLEQLIVAQFQMMFNACKQGYNFSFDQLNSNRVLRASEIEKADAQAMEEVSTSELEFECPITCEKDSPVLYIKKNTPVFEDIPKESQDFYINNPLAILNNPKLVAKIKSRFDKIVGFEATKKLLVNNQAFISPFTREPISSFISIADEISHKKATQFALADLFFGKKLPGVSALWLYVIYQIVKVTEHLQTEENFVGFKSEFKKYLSNQLTNNTTNLALSGLSSDGPLIKVPIVLAIWYCVASPKLNSVPNRFRAIGTKHHLDLLSELDYKYNRKWALHQLTIYRAFAWMLKQAKQDGKKLEKWIRSLYQNSLTLSDKTIIMLDGPAKLDPELLRISFESFDEPTKWIPKDPSDKQSDDFLLTLSVGEVLTLYQWIDPSKTLGDIAIPNEVSESAIPCAIVHYSLQENKENDATQLCPWTLRPFSKDRVSNKGWRDEAEEKFGSLTQQLSAYNYFIRYIADENEAPSQEEFIKWLAKKQAQRQTDPKDTLPNSIINTVENVFHSYEKVIHRLFSEKCSDEANNFLKARFKNFFENFQLEKSKYIESNFTLTTMSIELFQQITKTSLNKERRTFVDSEYQRFNPVESCIREIINTRGTLFNRQGSSSVATESLSHQALLEDSLSQLSRCSM